MFNECQDSYAHCIIIIQTWHLQVLCGRGNNLHEVENCYGDHFLVSMPTKFRRNIWIKRGKHSTHYWRFIITTSGDYIVVESIPEGDKVKAEIVHILYPRQVKNLKEQGKWYAVTSTWKVVVTLHNTIYVLYVLLLHDDIINATQCEGNMS